MLVIVLVIPERPSGLEDGIVLFLSWRYLTLRIKFERCVGREDLFEQEVSLLVGELVRERDGFRERDVDRTFRREKRIKHLWIVLEESFFYVLGRYG